MGNNGAFYTGTYRNVFAEMGYKEADIQKRLEDTFNEMFYSDTRIFEAVSDDKGYITDTGNDDARTEGMSYGMMFCVQMNKKKEFDQIWNWAKTYMYQTEGKYKGYFSWSHQLDGTRNFDGPAPDGEEYFAMALLFASARWGDGEAPYNYKEQAQEILHTCVHKGENEEGCPMWDPRNYQIRFIPEADYTDPSYHLPHFYELFAMMCRPEDREFWKKAAKASREFLHLACNEKTGLCAEYTEYDGTPRLMFGKDYYFSDAYRTVANMSLDNSWFDADDWQKENADKLQTFFCENVPDHDYKTYAIDGTVIDRPAMHPVAIIATNAQASLASNGKYAKECVDLFWNTPLRKDKRRYYDNCLYMFAMLALSGNYRIYLTDDAVK